MSKQKIPAINNIRGIAMLGVLGIHTGAYSLSNPNVNIHLFALLDIVSRFSVPIFFFVSAFGLFFQQDINEKFDYPSFLRRRLCVVFIPYLSWSLLYLIYYTWTSGDGSPWMPANLLEYILFGLSSYHLYFLVILLWFYALMPVWRQWIRFIIKNPLPNLVILFFGQLAVNYYSTTYLSPHFENDYVNMAIEYRLNYWVVHYMYIFLLGGVFAVLYERVKSALMQHTRLVTGFFILSLAGMLGNYYYLLLWQGYTPEDGVNAVNQLSSSGILYTVGVTLFLFLFFHRESNSVISTPLLSLPSRHSYFIYLVHPFIMYALMFYLQTNDVIMDIPVVLCFYLVTLLTGISLAILMEKCSRFFPALGLLFLGRAKS